LPKIGQWAKSFGSSTEGEYHKPAGLGGQAGVQVVPLGVAVSTTRQIEYFLHKEENIELKLSFRFCGSQRGKYRVKTFVRILRGF
jgi:hypothetical protein